MPSEFYAHTPPENTDSWHVLSEHLNKVSRLSEQFAAKFGAERLARYAGLWHDLGKYSPEFQQYLKECHHASTHGLAKSRSYAPHAIHGAKLAAKVLQPLAAIIAGHHSGLPCRSKLKDRIAELSEANYQLVLANAATQIELRPQPGFEQEVKALSKDGLGFELMLRMLFSCLVDADYLDTEKHFMPTAAAQRGRPETMTSMWVQLKTDQESLMAMAEPTPVNRVRAEVYQACLEAAQLPAGVFRLAVPTGGGKTRSGLAFALAHAIQQGQDRVIVAVPYTSIIEQTVEVYRKMFGQSAVLEHHSAIRLDEKDDEDARRLQTQARLATHNWDAPLVVTTTVQLLESLFANRPSRCRKIHNIANSVVILDEVQTLPVSLLKAIVNLLQGLCQQYRVTLVLCTATQPALEGNSPYFEGFEAGSVRDIVEPMLAKAHFSSLSRVNYEIPAEPWAWADVAEDLQKSEQGLVVLNTRRDALNVLAEMQSREDNGFVLHLSTLLCGAHRREVLSSVRQKLKSKEPCYLISTQVVEAGVDLDFPVVYRAVGPLDRIVQAAGRCNREGKLPEKGRVVVFTPVDGKVPPGEYRTAVDETVRVLRRTDLNFDDPAIFEDYFHSLYQGLETDKHNIQTYRQAMNYPEVAQRFKLIADDTTAVVIQYDDVVRDRIHQIRRRGLNSSDHRALQPYLVNLRDREFRQSQDSCEEIAPGIWVWRGSYDPIYGIGFGDRAIDYDPTDLIH
jgi:CRISPR-associated endonuclease/helicase Cas3